MAPRRDDGFTFARAQPGGLAPRWLDSALNRASRAASGCRSSLVICLLDAARLDEPDFMLEDYVRAGGGLGCSSTANRAAIANDRLGPEAVVCCRCRSMPTQQRATPASRRPTSRRLTIPCSSLRWSAKQLWQLPGSISITASIRSGRPPNRATASWPAAQSAPLVVEKQLGLGRIVATFPLQAVASVDGPGAWATSTQSGIPVLVNELIGYLSAAQRRFLRSGDRRPRPATVVQAVSSLTHGPLPAQTATTQRSRPKPSTEPGSSLPAKCGRRLAVRSDRREGKTETRYVAVNRAAGDRSGMRDRLAEILRDVDFQYVRASDLIDVDQQLIFPVERGYWPYSCWSIGDKWLAASARVSPSEPLAARSPTEPTPAQAGDIVSYRLGRLGIV